MEEVHVSNNGLNDIRKWEDVLNSAQKYFFENLEKIGTIPISISDFQIVKTIGTGGFGRVVLATDNRSNDYYAIKILDKELIVEKKQVAHVLNEKRILQAMKFPFIVNLICFFKDNCYLYFVMPFLSGGEMYSVLRREGKLSEPQTSFYSAQVVLALEFLHSLGIAYRDLKLENLLLNSRGYLRLTDLGFCKILAADGRTHTVCGTPEYLAPEVIESKGYGTAADMWSLGVVVWELCAGYPPFYTVDRVELFQLITAGLTGPCPDDFSPEIRTLFAGLLEVDPEKRLDASATRKEKWFEGTNWMGILNQTDRAPFVPQLSGPGDTRYYDSYNEEGLKTSEWDTYQENFLDF